MCKLNHHTISKTRMEHSSQNVNSQSFEHNEKYLCTNKLVNLFLLISRNYYLLHNFIWYRLSGPTVIDTFR